MKKIIKSFAYLFCVIILFNSNSYANNSLNSVVDNIFFKNVISSMVFAPPTVTTPIYYCQNSTAAPLTATPSDPSAVLKWYNSPTGGTQYGSAPTPSTDFPGTTSYYVSETIGGIESTRTKIDVNVFADNGSKILLLRCDPTQIAPADKASSVFFDWTNTPGLPNLYTYSYSVDGAPEIYGNKNDGTNLQVLGLSPGQSVTIKVWHTTYPCDRSEFTCSVPCGTSTVTPDFPAIAPLCYGTSTVPVLGPKSPNNIEGTWSPATVSNTISEIYEFTPDPVLFPCATKQMLSIDVIPLATPTFGTVPTTVCQNATPPTLPSISSNPTPITGTWNPSTVDTSTLGPSDYIFTPSSGECVASATTTVTITVNSNVTPTFTQVPPICSGTALAALPTTSNEGITGAWSPAVNNTATTTYTFTPTTGQCANTTTMTISVTPNVTPTFTAVAPICPGDPLAPLPTTSNNNYTGTWSPALDNMVTTTYTFTPDAGQCATIANLTITVNQLNPPVFTTIPASVCENDVPPILPFNSSDNPSITGTWSPSTVDTSVLGTSDYVFTPDPGQCAITTSVSITVNPSNTLVDFTWTVTEAFSENQVITITASGVGDYLYQLDDGPFQDSPVFEHVSAGYHSVTVEDVTGCSVSLTKSDILVVGYPRFFTPNNDGYNDDWNIFTLENQTGSRIRIFDRYGKFLKEISPNGTGWNGTYNGRPLPATDYWFVVDYPEDGMVKQYKSHFTLKR